jgi:NADH-quinone oxidoreductase subunit L
VLTSLYTFRVIFVVFFGPEQGHVVKRPGAAERIPLYILAALSVAGGFAAAGFEHFMETALPRFRELVPLPMTLTASGIAASIAFAAGLLLAWLFYLRRREWAAAAHRAAPALHRLWYTDWGMDWLYDRLFVRPIVWLARVDKSDAVDAVYRALAWLARGAWQLLSWTQSGRLRWYAAGIAGGAALLVAIALFL